MIRDVSDETKHVPDGPAASTKFVPDGPNNASNDADGTLRMPEPSGMRPAADPTGTQHVPDGPIAAAAPNPGATRDIRGSSSADSPVPRFGRYGVTAQLGAGGMGVVYRAHDEVLGRDVAIKVLSGEGDLGIRERFVREARAIGAVLHPNILAVYDAGEANGSPYLVMELAGSGTLRDRIKAERQLPVETVREAGIQIARALVAAHGANIIHRDVKPANILCTQQGTWKLADFGIARVPDSTLTVTGQFLGSPSYAAPESLRAGQFSAASDIYSLGATLYEALAGSPPHGDHDMQSIVRKLEADAPPLATRRAVPGPLGAAIMAALARDPAQRPTADELARQLAQTDDAAAAPVIAHAATARSHRMKILAGALAGVALLAIVLAVRSKSEPAAHVPGVTRPIEAVKDPSRESDGDSRAPAGWDDSTAPGTLGEAAAPEAPQPPEAPGMPMVVDQFGNPVDEETAKAILDQMEQDAHSSVRGRGRGRSKKHKDD